MDASNWAKVGAGLIVAADLAMTAAMPVSIETKLAGTAIVAGASAIVYSRNKGTGND